MLSLIIPAHNEAALIEDTLRVAIEAAGQCGQPFEVIVVDDASTDATARLAEALGVKVIRVEHRHIAATRNAGAREARGDLLVFIDADTLIDAATLRSAVRAIDRGAIGGGAAVRFDMQVGFMGWLFLGLWNGFSRFTHWASGCFIFVRREAFATAGGFDERFYAGEEIYLSRALKRQGRFVILRERVETSGRKMRMHSPARWIPMVFKLLLLGPRGWQSRDHLWMWYDGKRENR